jgi:hypothetical protein
MSELGRISGPLLKANLERHGVDLAFETDLIYLSVVAEDEGTKQVGIGITTDAPQRELHIGNDIVSEHRKLQTTNLIVDNGAELADLYLSDNKIQNLLDEIIISPNPGSTPTVETTRIGTLNLRISDKLIENITSNSDINLNPNGTGEVIFNTSEVDIDGNMHATGDITYDGNIIFGNSDSDNVSFNSDVSSDLIPNIDDTYNLGSVSKQWKTLHVTDLKADNLVVDNLIVNGIDLLLTQGKIWYVSVNGNDTNTGDHLHDTFLTIKHALSQATAGDEILIFPGTYQEEWPLEIPQGVTVKGSGIRAVTVIPTLETNTESCFLLNGETTVEFLTVKDFYSPGYAFELAPGYSSSTKSPYIYNVTVITQETPGSPISIIPGPAPTGVSLTSNSVTLDKSFYSQALVDSLVGQTAVIDRYPLQPLYYTVVSIETEPLSPTQWRMTVDTTFAPTGQLKPISFYSNADAIEIVTNDIWDTTGNSIGEKWVAWYKYNLPINFETTVQPGWTINVAGTLYIVDYIIEDPVNTTQWRIYVTTSLVGGTGIPIFSSPVGDPIIAGGGAFIDGGVANSTTQLPPTALFFSTTFIVPGGQGLVATNGARIEWLNSFTYFAETGIRLETGTLGVGGSGNTIVTLGDITGTITPGDTFTYYDQSGSTILATGIVEAVDGNIITLDGYVGNLDLISEITAGTFTPVGTARLTQLNYKFETASLYLDGASYVTGSDNIQFSLDDGDFCLEAWLYPTAFPTTECTLFSQWGLTSVEQAYKVTLTSTGGIKVYLNDGSATELTTGIEYLLSESGDIITDELGNPIISEDETLITGAWQHVAVVRYNDVLNIYVGGISKASVSLVSGAVINDGTGPFNFGHTTGDTEYYTGYIDEFRLSRNNAIFTGEFTPPTAEYATVDSTTAILMHFDGTESSTVFTNVSTPIQKIVLTSAVADRITGLDYKAFAAEMRSINSANVYGTYGAVAEGRDTLGYLIGHNFGYIGSGTDSSNDRSLVVQANEVVEIDNGKIYYDSVDHKGDYRVGDIFYVNQETGDVVFNAEAIDFLPSGSIVLEGAGGTTTINAQYIQTGNLRIYDNNIDSLIGPVNWSAFSGTTTLETNVNITGDLDITGDFTIDGTLYLGNNSSDTITFNSEISQDIIPNTTGLTLGESSTRWDTLYASLLNVDGVIEINSNSISILTTDTNLVLTASGTGIISVDSDVEIDNKLTVGTGLTVNGDSSFKDVDVLGTITQTGDIDQTGDFNTIGNVIANNYIVSGLSSYFEVPNIKIENNEISVTATNDDLELLANGTGGVGLDNYLKLTGTTISNVFSPATTNQQKSIVISPSGSGNLVIDSVTALQIPAGNNTNRVLSSNGEIRFNNSFSGYEGFDRTGNVSLSGLYSQLRDTYITPELTIGANDNTLRFGINSVVRATIDSAKLYTPTVDVDNIRISGSTINNTSLTENLIFSVSGTGKLNVNSTAIKDSTIENLLNTPLTIQSTGDGYVRFMGSGAVVIPYGTNTERRVSPEVGEIRNNNQNPAAWTMEVYDGVDWISAVGTQGAASLEDIEDTINLYSIILG